MAKKERKYKFNYIYSENNEAKDFDKMLERLFTKYLIEYE